MASSRKTPVNQDVKNEQSDETCNANLYLFQQMMSGERQCNPGPNSLFKSREKKLKDSSEGFGGAKQSFNCKSFISQPLDPKQIAPAKITTVCNDESFNKKMKI